MNIWLHSLLFHHGARPVTSPTPSSLACQLRRVGSCVLVDACGFALSSPVFLVRPGGVVLFVFRLGVLVVNLEGIAVCGYCGVHALRRSVCFLAVFARCCMFMQALLVGKARMV